MDLLKLSQETLNENILHSLSNNCECSHCYREKYSGFHIHTKYSIRDGLSPIDKLVEKADRLGWKRVMPTDHGTIASVYEVFKECDKYPNLKAGIGCELYIVHSSEKATQSQPHITTIVQTEEGWKNMLKLQYLSAIKEEEGEIEGLKGSYGYKPHITEQHLFHFQKGLIVGSGCRLSLPNNEFWRGDHQKGLMYLDMLRNNIDQFLIELHVANNEVEERLFWFLKKYAEEYNLKTIIANDSHYNDLGQVSDWQLVSSLRGRLNLQNTHHRVKNDDFYLKSYDEIFLDTRRCFVKGYTKDLLFQFKQSLYSIEIALIPQWHIFISYLIGLLQELHNQSIEVNIFDEEVSELFNGFEFIDDTITFDWGGDWSKRKLPKLHYEEAEDKLKKVLWANLKKMFDGSPPQKYIDRIKEEFKIAKETDNISYFYLVGVLFLERCLKEGLMLSEGRGSASSLLMSKLLNCARVDPLEFDLIIDRAMNRDRKKLMDIDLDFASSESKKAKDILFDVVGKNNAVAIGNYGYNGVKQSIQSVGRFFKIPPYLMDELTSSKELNFYEEEYDEEDGEHKKEISKADNEKMLEILKNHSFIKNLNYNPFYLEWVEEDGAVGKQKITGDLFYEYVLKLYDTISNLSVHASGILIFNQPIWELVPITRINDTLISQWDMGMLEELEGLKLDVLKIKSNDLVKRGLNYLKQYNLLEENYDDKIKKIKEGLELAN